MNPPGGLLLSQTFVKTEEIACASRAGYKNADAIWSQVRTKNKQNICRAEKDRKEMYQGVPRNVPEQRHNG